MRPEPKVFSKAKPCTKLDIWNCFRDRRGFASVPMVEAHAVIGVNVPRGMESRNRLYSFEAGGVVYYALTEIGAEWLTKGFKNYLKNHPTHRARAKFVPRNW